MAAPLYTTASGLLFHAGKILVVTVGLPARGKTHISRALERYLRWLGVKTQVVSLGDYRRKTLGGAQKLPKDYFTLGEKTPETKELRQRVSDGCEDQVWKFFEGGGQVVIFDANNGSKSARKKIAEKFQERKIHVVFLESVCDNKDIVEANIRSVKISSPDYKNWDPELAVADYYSRIHDHEKHYETVDEIEWPFIRIINVGEKIEVNKIQGYLQSGQSLVERSYKADSDLSPAGWEYAEKLKTFVLERRAKTLKERGISATDRRLDIWTSARRRAHHTAWPFLAHSSASTITPSEPELNVKITEKPQMSEINPGVWDGLTPELARKQYPNDWERFIKDPYSYRAPRAESYHDLCVRLEPVLIELERAQNDLLIIGHASVIRCLLSYLIGLPASEIPAIEVARGDLMEVIPASYGVNSRAFHFWDGVGRSGDGDEESKNFYENYAEDTKGKKIENNNPA